MKLKIYRLTKKVALLLVLSVAGVSCIDDGFEEFEAPQGNVNGIQPNTIFTVGNAAGDLGVNFRSFSTDARSYQWDFGNGETSTAANPDYVYPEGGLYTVVLETVSSDGLTAIDSTQVAPVSAAFAIESIVDSEVTFTSTTSGVETYLWDFGDGETSEEASPVHTYSSTGPFNVTLTVSGFDYISEFAEDADDNVVSDGNELVLSETVSGLVLSTIPEYSAEVDGTEVTFTDASVNAVSWAWDFGDGTGTSTDPNPIYVYAAEGEYQVTLTTTNSAGVSRSITKTINASANAVIGDPVTIEGFDFEPVGGSNSGGYTFWRWNDREDYSNNPYASTSTGFDGRGAKWDDGHSRLGASNGDIRTSYQALNVTPNAAYTLEFYSRVDTPGDYIEVLILDGHYDTPTAAIASTPLLDASTTDTSGSFVLNSVEFTANATGEIAIMMSAYIANLTSGPSVYLDNISLTPVGAN